VSAELDDDARRLFGAPAHRVDVQAERLVDVMRTQLGFRVVTGCDPSSLLVDRVTQSRRGHPVVLAALATELCSRAGIEAAVYSSPERWFVGVGSSRSVALLDAGLEATAVPPAAVRRHCAHEVGFCVLTGLVAAFLADGRIGDARLASRLRLELPMSDGLLETVRRELQALPEE
jgi:hypothetical protein